MGKRRNKSRRSTIKKSDTIVFKEGIMVYHIAKTEKGLACPCINRTTSPCRHIRALLIKKNVDDFAVEFYDKFSSLISESYDSNDLRNIILNKKKEIMEEECGFCCEELKINYKNQGWVMCSKCLKLTHSKCCSKWSIKRSDCIYCRYDPEKEKMKRLEDMDFEVKVDEKKNESDEVLNNSSQQHDH